MSFQFGGVRASQAPKKIAERVECLITEHVSSDYLLALVDCKPSDAHLKIFEKTLQKYGITSYIIVSCINEKVFAQKSVTDLLTVESNWRKYLKFNDYKAACVLTLGHALYCAQKSADTLPYHYIDHIFCSTRIFLSNEFLNAGDLWYYPTYSMKELIPLEQGADYVNFKTRTFYAQLEKIIKDDKSTNELDMRPYNIIVSKSVEETSKILDSLCNAEFLSLDIETTGLDFMRSKIGCVTLSVDGETGYYLPWDHILQNRNRSRLRKCFTTAKTTFGSNLAFDVKFFWKNGIEEQTWYPTDDGMIRSQSLHSDLPKGAKPNAYRYTYFGGYDLELDRALKELDVDNFMEIPIDVLSKYATLDVIVAWRVFKAMDEHTTKIDNITKKINEKNKKWTVRRWYNEVMLPFYREIIELEYVGLYVNTEHRETAEKDIKKVIESNREKLVALWNPVLKSKGKPQITDNTNLSSTTQLGRILEDMGWPKVEEAEGGGFGTGDVSQKEWKRLKLPGVDELAVYRSHSTGLGSFIGDSKSDKASGWPQYFREHEDGTTRMHTSFNVMGTKAYRCSAREPSTQNIPSHGKMAPIVKRCISPPISTPNYTITDDEGNVWKGRGSDYLVTDKGEVRFCEIIDTDKILGYGRKTPHITTVSSR